MLGIDNLKKGVKFACDFTKQMAEALADKKFTWMETFGFVDELIQVPGLVKSWPELKQEVADLTEEEKTELFDYLRTEFDLPNEDLEVLVEDSLNWIVITVTLVGRWKK